MRRRALAKVFIFLSLLLPPAAAAADDILPFEPDDTLEEIRYKIDYNGYLFEVEDTWVFSMPEEEKAAFFSRRQPREPRALTASDEIGPLAKHLSKRALPSSFDWRDVSGRSYIGPIRDQGYCGSCYAFGANAAAEGTYNYAMGLYDANCIDLSESYIIWCLARLPQYGSHFYGCDGADYDYAELAALVEVGVGFEADFSYRQTDPGSCTHWSDQTIAFESWHRVPCNDIDAIKTAIMTYGVVDAAVYVGSAFQGYSSGIYEDSNTTCNASPCYYAPTNHAIALVGWDDSPPEGGGGVWILRNSWGESWGEGGYMRLRYTSARVACAVSYLVYREPASPTPTPDGYRTPSPTPTVSITPAGYKTPSPTPSPSATPSPRPYTVPFSEDFEGEWSGGAPEGWSREHITGITDWSKATQGYNGHPLYPYNGSYIARLNFNGSTQKITRLITPRLDFGSRTVNPRLVFYLAMEEWWDDQDELTVLYRASSGGGWNLLTHYDYSIPNWSPQTLDLPDPGNDYYICFLGTANWGYGICLDSVLITGDPVGPTPIPPPATVTPTPPPSRTPTPIPTPDFGTPTIPPSRTPTPVTPPATATPTPSPSRTSTPVPPPATATTTPSPSRTPTPVTPPATATPPVTATPIPNPTCGTPLPRPGSLIAGGDYDGDGLSDIAVFRPDTGLWAVRGVTRAYFGRAGDLPVPGDYAGWGRDEIAIFRFSSGLWAVKGVTRAYFGKAGDFPVPGDYRGDGIDRIAIFRPGTGLWVIRGITRTYFGREGDFPVLSDYSGDGTVEIAVFRPASGLWAIKDLGRIYFGGNEDWPVPGDYGFGERPAVFRPSTGLWAIRGMTRIYFGSCLDQPVPGEYPGSGFAAPGIFRPVSGLWAIRGVTRVYFGTDGDLPVTR